MFGLGTTELIVILLVVLLIFGVGRLGRIGGEMGKAIREFRTGLSGEAEQPGAEQPEQTAR